MPPQPTRSRQRPLLQAAALAAIVGAALDVGSRSLCWAAQGLQWRSVGRAGHGPRWPGLRSPPRSAEQSKTPMAATATDTFDPWTVLGISTEAGVPEARKAYKKLIAKYHPDVDPSPEAEVKFQEVVRAHAVITGEDRDLEQSTLLKNAVENLRNDIEFKKAQIERMKEKAVEEEAKVLQMQERLEQAEVQRDKVNQELGAFGGGTIGLIAGGPTGAVVGAVLGLALKDRDDSVGQVIRGVGTLTKGVVDAGFNAIAKK